MVWQLALDMRWESVLAVFPDLLTGPTSRRALANRDIAAVYRILRALALLGAAREAVAALRRAEDSHHATSDESPPWEHFGTVVSHIEGGTYFALGRFHRAARALSAATEGASQPWAAW